jgi:hypothetical protein
MRVEYINKDGRTEAQLSDQSDWKLFDRMADLIEKEFHGTWVEKLDGLDQRYWDVVIGNIKLTLHLEHYLGISLFPAKGDDNPSEANKLVQMISEYIEANAA